MAIDFPSSPSNGTTYTYNGVTYVYNSTTDQWIVQGTGSSELYVLKTGDTMTGSLTSVGYSGTTGTFSGDLSAAVIRSGGNPDNGADIGAYYGPGYSAICRNGAQNVYTVYQQGTIANTAAIFADGSAVFGNNAAGPNITLGADGSGTFSASLQIGPNAQAGDNPFLTVGSGNRRGTVIIKGPSPDANASAILVEVPGSSTAFQVTHDGTTKVGGTSSNPNIALNADGSSYFKGEVRVERSSTCVTCITGGGDGTALIYFQTNQPAELGKIRRSGSGVAYDTTSDYRLKENFEPISNAVSRVKSLNPLRFNFIDYPELTVDGFIAHEAKEVVPESVGGTKDEVDSEGKPVYQTIDQSKLVPLLTAALQESITRIEALEAQLSQLTTTGGASS